MARQAAAAGGGGEPTQKRARSLGVDAGEGGGAASRSAGVRKEKKGSSAPATAPASASRAPLGSLVDVTVEDAADALDCGVCFLPLKPPIFQCDVGHVVCSLCRDKLQAMGKCHVCGIATGSYRRCHSMERLVESIRVPCLYAAHGCALRPSYYDQESHRLVCMHAPCHCPGEACSFVGSTSALMDHFSTVHRWPCITKVEHDQYGAFIVRLQDGFNFLADCSTATGNEEQGASASIQRLLLLTVAQQPNVRNISVHWIDPHAAAASGGQGPTTAKEIGCELSYSHYRSDCRDCPKGSGVRLIKHDMSSLFRVACTDLSIGLPKLGECCQLVVPNSIVGDYDKVDIEVSVRIFSVK